MYRYEGAFEKIIENLRNKRSTLLGISPVTEYVVISALKVASRLNAPIIFVASLNQVDVDGGYTGFTPGSFVKFVDDTIESQGLNSRVIFQLDHCGPWLKDDHIVKNYNYDEALNDVLRSVEEFIKAGFKLIHVDTTIDIERTNKTADIDTAIKRTVHLIDLIEDIARNHGIEVYYEIGSDRWGFKPVEIFDSFVSQAVSMLKRQNINSHKIIFVVADVGTKVQPGNRINEKVLEEFSRTALKYNYLLKIHSGDYLENPSVLPRFNVGGVNIGPMFADIQYQVVKEAILEIKDHKLLEKLSSLILSGDKIGKYMRKEKIEDYEIGLASRYIWSSREARELIILIERQGIPLSKRIIENMENKIEFYLKELNLESYVF
ncbi:MAG: class II D-tagatose-bisphosphate aldolase, non-catalytic subunit [Crenarchaeota archaeon]|nr:class II D-tagatose-bisphosphate aldolase, non-catalytic subunit [Thermoproteota archaeon]